MTVSNGCGEKLVFKRLILHDIEHENVENAGFSQCGTPVTLLSKYNLSPISHTDLVPLMTKAAGKAIRETPVNELRRKHK